MLIINNTKSAVKGQASLYHTVTILSNALMNCGTTSDEFLRKNLDWLALANNWSKFSATASLGLIHKGHYQRGQSLLSPYLPQAGNPGSPYSEGGSLYALGLIHANYGKDVTEYLTNALRGTQVEVVQHGACLGLGVAAMATDNEGTCHIQNGLSLKAYSHLRGSKKRFW